MSGRSARTQSLPMRNSLPVYLRTFRRQAGLTQRELAQLIGCPNDIAVSRLERSSHRPRLHVALACEVVFRASLRELFPDMYEEVEQLVFTRAHTLRRRLVATSRLTPRKRQCLKTVGRLTASSSSEPAHNV